MICAACSCSSGVGRLRITFAWPILMKPLFSSSSTFSGRFSRRRLLASALPVSYTHLVRQRMRSHGSRVVLPWGMMNSASRVMHTRMTSPGMGIT